MPAHPHKKNCETKTKATQSVTMRVLHRKFRTSKNSRNAFNERSEAESGTET